MRLKRPCSLVPALVAVLVAAACQSAPYTDRRQLLLVSEREMNQLGTQAFQQVLSESRPSTNVRWSRMVEDVGRSIAAVADRPDFEWEFRVIADPSVNAFCLPGGKVAFYEGILPICQDETGVAVVMGHEVAHAIAQHGAERVSQSMIADLGTTTASTLLGETSPATQQLVTAALGAGVSLGVLLPYSRKHESEADQIGLILMAKAGFDPRAAPAFWERMQSLEQGGRPPEFLSTHPNPGTRIRQLQEWMPQALQYYVAGRPGGL